MMLHDLVRALKIVDARVGNPEDALRAANDLLLLHIDEETVTLVYRAIEGKSVIEPHEEKEGGNV
jgi:hypothetical protein